jgi:hypothetical protein
LDTTCWLSEGFNFGVFDGKWMFVVGENFTRYTNFRTKVIEVVAFAPASRRM